MFKLRVLYIEAVSCTALVYCGLIWTTWVNLFNMNGNLVMEVFWHGGRKSFFLHVFWSFKQADRAGARNGLLFVICLICHLLRTDPEQPVFYLPWNFYCKSSSGLFRTNKRPVVPELAGIACGVKIK